MRNAGFAEMIDFTRPGTATYVDADGMIRIAAADVPRFDYTNGRRQLLLEGPATNLSTAYTSPEDTSGITLNGTSLEGASISVVDDLDELEAAGLASVTGGRVYKLDNSGGTNTVFAFFGLTGAAGDFTLSVFARGAFNLVLVGEAASENLSSENYVRFEAPLSCTQGRPAAIRCFAGAIAYFCLPQIETGRFASSYIPTDGSSVTRAADNAQLAEPVAALLRRREASVLTQVSVRGVEGVPGPLVSSDFASILSVRGSGVITSNSEGLGAINTAGAVDYNEPYAAAFAWGANGRSIAATGAGLNTDTVVIRYTVAEGFVGRTLIAFANGWYDQLVVWPFRTSDDDLQRLAVPYA